ncbi:jg19584 [Pararge aegeria aegeria]|uniref:Jg19584 protein n=2 Tax=Pararge aegeria TaxID=116150 RepID=A0A8S4R471_9NEOP|nr:jg19584 [Pararge aegeria aegeria]
MKNECEIFLDQLNEKTVSKFPPFRYLLEIDVMGLLELFPELGEHLIKEPLKWQRYCNDILYACLKTSDNEMNQRIQSSQVAVNIRLKSFPHVLFNFKMRHYSGIVSFKGLLINVCKPTNYVYHTVWSCPEECEGNEIILQFIPKTPPKCYLCRSTLFENSGLRRCDEQVEATFKFKNDLLPKKYTIINDLIEKLKLGDTYFINAVVLKKATAIWSLEVAVMHPAPTTSPIPKYITKIFDACDRKPWMFTYCLASRIGVKVCPADCFVNVKINLLLSIISIRAQNWCGSRILHCLAAGHDTRYVAEIMRQACLLANSNVLLGTSNCSVATALIGASGGVCVMPLPLQVYNQKQIHSIVTAIETGEIQHETGKVKLNCAVWAHGMDFKRIVLYDVARVFGTVCRADYGEYTNELADFILQQTIEPFKTTTEDKQTLNDISIYMDIVGGIKVSIGEETQHLLSNYFLAARREKTKAVSAGNMESLVTICAMSARLCCRSAANIDDAIFAIWLHASGMAEPRFAPDEYLETPNDINKLNSVIEKFVEWLENFTGCCIVQK